MAVAQKKLSTTALHNVNVFRLVSCVEIKAVIQANWISDKTNAHVNVLENDTVTVLGCFLITWIMQ